MNDFFLSFQIFTPRRVSPSLKMVVNKAYGPMNHVVNKAMWEDCKAGNVEEVRRALESGADPNSHEESWTYSSTCLMIASEENHGEVVSLLLEQPTIEVNMVGPHDETALHLTCLYNKEAALRRLLSAPGLEMNGLYSGQFTPIMFAVGHGNLECVRLLSAVAEVDLDCKFSYYMTHVNQSLEER